MQIREDAAHALEGLGTDRIWTADSGISSAGFHAKHLAGSTRRLCAYLEGRQLNAAELAESRRERTGTEGARELVAEIDAAFARYESLVADLDPNEFGSIREIGRQRLPVTAISLAIHIAEHGQRHVGQLISTIQQKSPNGNSENCR
jgi:uncharacterized damage-inducible protein DinB